MVAHDLGPENATLKGQGTLPVAGILGADILWRLGAVVDVGRREALRQDAVALRCVYYHIVDNGSASRRRRT